MSPEEKEVDRIRRRALDELNPSPGYWAVMEAVALVGGAVLSGWMLGQLL